MSVSVAETLNRYRVARRTADRLIEAHNLSDDPRPLSVAADALTDDELRLFAAQPLGEATKALVMELLREHVARVVGHV